MNSTLLSNLGGRGESVALLCEDRRITYGELEQQSNRLARALLELGLHAGDLFAFLLPNSPEILSCYIACARTGIVGLPLSQRITSSELAFQLKDSGAVALLYGRDFAGLVGDQRSELPEVHHMLGEDFIEQIHPSNPVAPNAQVKVSDPFCVMYTGGTTGRSKAAIQTHQSWMCSLETSVEQWKLSTSDRHLIALPMSHAAWFTAGAALQAGGNVTIARNWNPGQVLDLVEKNKITTLNMIPTMLNDLVTAFETKPRDVRSVRLLTVAGALLPVATYHRARDIFGEVIGNIYGLTEAAGPVTFLLPSEMRAGKFRSVGRPGKHVELAILDNDGKPASQLSRGELGLAGPQVTTGYLRNPEETRKAFSGKWFLTGDVAEIDDEGFVFIVDRKKDMIKTGGFNVYPNEIEQVLYRHPDILEAAVIGVRDKKWMEALHAVVVLRPSANCSADDIIGYCRTELAGYKVPKAIHFALELPRTRFGKFDKAQMRNALIETLLD